MTANLLKDAQVKLELNPAFALDTTTFLPSDYHPPSYLYRDGNLSNEFDLQENRTKVNNMYI